MSTDRKPLRILVTAGPTREFIDPVRFISNRSSGKMGYAIAMAARDRGHEVTLVSGPVALPAPPYVTRIPVVTAAEMLKAVEEGLDRCDVLVMAAAVADWCAAEVRPRKMKKSEPLAGLALAPTPDILKTIKGRKGGRLFVGFAAETGAPESEARRKLVDKGLDLIIANDITEPGAGFDVDTNRVILLTPGGAAEALPLMSKREVAEHLVSWIEHRTGGQKTAPAGDRLEERVARFAGGDERLARQVAFIREIDALKSITRRTLLMDGSRYENDAEHSWHLAMMALLLRDYANVPGLDVERVIRMVLVHDLVEIDAGDTYCYDDRGNADKAAREQRAADRLFGLLPTPQGAGIRALWEEFEARVTPEARFAAALDRVQPLLHNYCTGGAIWKKHGVHAGKVRERNRHVGEGSEALWRFAEALIRDAVQRGYLDE